MSSNDKVVGVDSHLPNIYSLLVSEASKSLINKAISSVVSKMYSNNYSNFKNSAIWSMVNFKITVTSESS